MSSSTRLSLWRDDGTDISPKNAKDIKIPEGKVLKSAGIKTVESLDPDTFIDGGLENWTDPNNLTNWDEGRVAGVGGSLDRESVIVHSGTYAAKLTAGTPGQGPEGIYYIAQLKTGLTQNDKYRIKFWSRKGTSSMAEMLVFNNVFANATQVYNFATKNWVEYPTDVNDNHHSSHILSTTYTQFVVPDIPVPASNKLYPVFIVVPDIGDEYYYLDGLTFQKVNSPNSIVIRDFQNPSDASNLDDTDYIDKIRTTGGTSANVWGLKKTAGGYLGIETSLDGIDLSGKKVLVADPTPSTNEAVGLAYLQSYLAANHPTLVGSAVGINFLNTGQTTLYTVPTGKKLLLTQFYVYWTTVTNYTSGPIISAGTAGGGYNEIFNGYSIMGASINRSRQLLSSGSIEYPVFTEGSIIKIDVDTGAAANAMVGNVYLFGVLLDL